ncbi:MAG TPA: polyprenyl diphosphate synthase [Solirubrobacteraceae bacterium]|nr:polyprenyl diphosphate synthase [Solirubrobacteraceae bacterium]
MARYVAIIADGNRRWARKRELSAQAGHDAAADTLSARVRDAARLGVEELSVYVFSTENWWRPSGEIAALMAMLCRRLASETPGLHEEGVRMRFTGAREGISTELLEQMDSSQSLTERNDGLTLYMALNYGGRAEIVHAARCFDAMRVAQAAEGRRAGPRALQSSDAEFAGWLYQPEMHDPELIIRTGGEHRLSNFLLWQSAYSELVFRDELWPEFDRGAFEASLSEFNERKRRFGGR